MPPIEVGTTRPIGAIDVRIARAAGAGKDTAASAAPARADASRPAVVKSHALDAGEAPIDAERVTMIRKAVESGTYPVIPVKVADAMIAAGMLLRNAK